MIKRVVFSITVATLLVILSTQQFASAQTFVVTVSTDKPSYGRGESVFVSGNVTLDGIPVSDSVVAIQVNKPTGDPLVVRASTTGSTGGDWRVEVLEVYPSDHNGIPKTSFKRGTTAYYTTVVRNKENFDQYLTLILNLYYSGGVPFDVKIPFQGPIGPGNQTIIVSDPIASDSPLGTVTVYANAFSELPIYQGYAYSPEKSTSYTITSTVAFSLADDATSQTIEPTSLDGSYSLYFRLSPSASLGNYSIYASSSYQGQLSTATSTYEVELIGDINNDGKVDGKDLAIAAKAFGTIPGDTLWDPRADINTDGRVDGKDIAIISKNFGQTS